MRLTVRSGAIMNALVMLPAFPMNPGIGRVLSILGVRGTPDAGGLDGNEGTIMADWIETQITTKLSPRSVTDTVARLSGILSAKGMKVFAVIDQREQAHEAGLELRETTLVLFGNPAAGTPVMDTPLTDALVAP
jgi:hypothetical protein